MFNFRLLHEKSWVSNIFPLFFPKSLDIKKTVLQPFRTYHTDTLTYLGHFHIQSRSKSAYMYLKKNFFIIFIKGSFKAIDGKWNIENKFQQNTIFFKKLKSMSRCLKNSFHQIKPTSYRYFWKTFHYGISGFEYRNPSKIPGPALSVIWRSL